MLKCMVCGVSDIKLLFEGRDLLYFTDRKTFLIQQCQNCKLVFINPLLSKDELSRYYPEEYESFHREKEPWFVKIVSSVKVYNLVRQIKKNRGLNAKILEIGCGTGERLSALRGFGFINVVGVEPSSVAAGIAKSKGLKIYNSFFEDAPINEKYDVILMKHVFEHLVDPIFAFQKLSQLLKADGILVIEIPNYDSWDRIFLGRYWPGYDVPRHLFTFNFDNFQKLARVNGFQIFDIKHDVVPNNWIEGVKMYLLDRGHKQVAKFFSIYNILLLLIFTPINIIQVILSRSGRIKLLLRKV